MSAFLTSAAREGTALATSAGAVDPFVLQGNRLHLAPVLSDSDPVRCAAPSDELTDQDWRSGALCAQNNPDLWFAVGALEHKYAKKICRECPVRRECLAYAMEAPIDHGIWGGLTERERRRYRRRAGQGDWRAALA